MREMLSHFIISYEYGKGNEKIDSRYREHVPTKEEAAKTKELMDKLEDFIIKTEGEDSLKFFHSRPEGNIQYIEGDGYVSIVNFDRNEVNVYGYGETVDEAFLAVLIDYEFYVCENYEIAHRSEFNQQFSDRFLDGVCQKSDNFGPFFWAELVLQEFRKYYGDNMPDKLMDYFYRYLKRIGFDDFKYSFEDNCLVHRSGKGYIKR